MGIFSAPSPRRTQTQHSALRVLVSPCARSAGEEDSRSVGVGSVCDAALAAAPVRLGGLRRAPLGDPTRVRRESDEASGEAPGGRCAADEPARGGAHPRCGLGADYGPRRRVGEADRRPAPQPALPGAVSRRDVDAPSAPLRHRDRQRRERTGPRHVAGALRGVSEQVLRRPGRTLVRRRAGSSFPTARSHTGRPSTATWVTPRTCWTVSV